MVSWIDIGFLVLIVVLVAVDMALDARRDRRTERSLAYLVGIQQLEARARASEPVPGARHKLSPPRCVAGTWDIPCACGWVSAGHMDASSALDAGELHIRSISKRRSA